MNADGDQANRNAPLRPNTCTSCGAFGADAGNGTTHGDGADTTLVPAAFDAVIVNWYGTFSHNPATHAPESDAGRVIVLTAGVGHTAVTTPAFGVAVTVYPVTASARSFGNHAANTANPSPETEVINGCVGTVPAFAATGVAARTWERVAAPAPTGDPNTNANNTLTIAANPTRSRRTGDTFPRHIHG